MSACRRCVERGQTWSGDAPNCAFPDGVFRAENWNCATANALRDVAEKRSAWNDDQNAALVPMGDETDGLFLLVGWYKRRGRTEYIGVFTGSDVREATVEDVESALAYDHGLAGA